MLNPLFPRQADNTRVVHKVALWLFGLVVLMKSVMALNSTCNSRWVAGSADGIPLDTFTAVGAQTVVALFAAWGFAQLMICLLCVLVLVRYRTLVPLLFTILLTEHLGRKLIFYLLPIARTGTPPGTAVNIVMIALMVAGLALSLRSQAKEA